MCEKTAKKTAFVMGAGGYIGRAAAEQLAMQGIAVAVCDIDQKTAKATAQEIVRQGGTANTYFADITDSSSVNEAIDKAVLDFGRLDIMVNAAGSYAMQNASGLIHQTDEAIRHIIGVNLMGAFYASRAAARRMIAQGTGGRIINFSSVEGIVGAAGMSECAAAKGGVIGLTRALAKELGEHKITVNSVAPGVVTRPGGESQNNIGETNFLGECCSNTDVANLVVFLASEEGRFITGQTYVIDGGRSLALKGTD